MRLILLNDLKQLKELLSTTPSTAIMPNSVEQRISTEEGMKSKDAKEASRTLLDYIKKRSASVT
jgi:hypothetical protein